MLKKSREKVAVIGGGIAGVLTAELLSRKGYEVHLFERSDKLGGCAGSFKREKFIFNIGATTIPGLKDGFPVKRFLKFIGEDNLAEIVEPSIVIHTKKGKVKRFSSFAHTLEEINKVFYYPGNYEFWKLVYSTTEEVLLSDFYVNFVNFKEAVKSVYSLRKLLFKYHKFFSKPALLGIRKFFPTLDPDYYNFLDAQVKITAQCPLAQTNFLTALICLGYPFTGVGYTNIGMGQLIENLAKSFKYYLKAEVRSLEKAKKGFIIKGSFGDGSFQKVILALPIMENLDILKDRELRDFFSSYTNLLSKESAFVVYGVIERVEIPYKFHLVILPERIPFFDSQYIFFSFNSHKENLKNYTIFTASTHTQISKWQGLSEIEYTERKELMMNKIIGTLCYVFSVPRERIILSFTATPLTFYRYLGRLSTGGIPITLSNPLWKIPSNFTPFKDLFLVGDSAFCYQGWLGISLGVKNLIENLV